MTGNIEQDRIQLVEERLAVTRRQIETDRVRVHTFVEARDVLIDETVRRGRLDIERVAVDREVGAAPAERTDGDVTIVSLVEERLVKRLFVIEELHIRKTTVTEAVSAPMTLRTMRAVIERDGEPIETGN